MQDELKRYNNIGDIAGVAYFANVVLKDDRILRSAAQKICSLQNNIRLNFNAAIAFFTYLDLIKQSDMFLFVTDKGASLRSQLNTNSFSFAICSLCFEKIINEGIIDAHAIHFSVVRECYYIERFGFSVSEAVFRNILIQHKALVEDGGNLLINNAYEALFEKQQKQTKLTKTLDELKKKLENQEVQGAEGELFVLAYEKSRFASLRIKDKIKQISTIDVSAGYDIVSFSSPTAISYDRFIEVKTYQGDLHFYWSENEIAKAKLYGDKYFLALVDYSKISTCGYAPLFIQNPAQKILGSDAWILTPTSYFIVPTDSSILDSRSQVTEFYK